MSKPLSKSQLLHQARALITNPNHWCQGSQARTAQGYNHINPWDPSAVQRCALGALFSFQGFGKPVAEIITLMANLIPDAEIPQHLKKSWDKPKHSYKVAAYNNTHTHQEVLALFDLAITETDRREV